MSGEDHSPTSEPGSDVGAPTKFRILHVAEAFGGGLLEAVRVMAAGAVEAGHAVAIAYGTRPETPASLDMLDPRIERFRLDWGRRSPPRELIAARQLRRVADRWDPDVVHLHSSFAGLVGTLTLRSRPTVFTPHSFASALDGRTAAARAAYRRAERYIVARADVIGAVSQSEASLARELGAGSRVRVVENGIVELNPTPREGVTRPSDGRRTGRPSQATPIQRPRVVASGRVVAQRRPEAVLRILSSIRDLADVAWIGGGDSAWSDSVRDQFDAAGVHLTGWLGREQAMAQIAGATIYLHWTAWDGQPLSVLEAMALDTLVVASDIEPNREVLGGRAVRATEKEAVELLRSLLVDPALAKRMMAEQRRRRYVYSAARSQRRWLHLYRQLIADRGRDRSQSEEP